MSKLLSYWNAQSARNMAQSELRHANEHLAVARKDLIKEALANDGQVTDGEKLYKVKFSITAIREIKDKAKK